MSDTHIIGWDNDKTKLWYAGKKADPSPYDTYGTNPRVTIQRTPFITDAIRFDTFEEAYEIYNTENIRDAGHAHIRYFTEKEIFKIKLEGG